jgi:putative ABC transport system substrate-binding protein
MPQSAATNPLADADTLEAATGQAIALCDGDVRADLPVQAPTKYETIVNLKTAKALSLDVSPSLLARADEVTE